MWPGYRGGGGTPHPAAHATRSRAGERGGHPKQAAHNPSVQPGGGGGGGGGKQQHAHLMYIMKEREWEETPDQQGKGGAPPDQRVLPAHSIQERRGRG